MERWTCRSVLPKNVQNSKLLEMQKWRSRACPQQRDQACRSSLCIDFYTNPPSPDQDTARLYTPTPFYSPPAIKETATSGTPTCRTNLTPTCRLYCDVTYTSCIEASVCNSMYVDSKIINHDTIFGHLQVTLWFGYVCYSPVAVYVFLHS